MSDARIKVGWIEGDEEFSIISVEVMVQRERRDKSAKWSSMQDEEKRTTNRTLRNTIGACMRGGETISTRQAASHRQEHIIVKKLSSLQRHPL